jgi:hypothetical protein
MNEIQRLQAKLEDRFPAAAFEIDAPLNPASSWWLDIRADDYFLTVEWRPGEGFGVTTPRDDGFGEGPDEIYRNFEAAAERVKALLLRRTRTTPPENLSAT